MANYPDWVTRQRIKGTEIRQIGSNYYLYRVTSRWDKQKKRPVKTTLGYVGRITETGLIKSKPTRVIESITHISVKEYGAFQWIWKHNTDIVQTLQQLFPAWWKELFVMSYLRLMHCSPLKHMDMQYHASFASETVSQARLGSRTITSCLREIGHQRGQIVAFLQRFVNGSEFVLIDATHVISFSEGVSNSRLGYNSQKVFDPQVNLLFIYSTDKKMPVYYRLVGGNIREIKALKLCVEESGLDNKAILVGDKGFYSKGNVESLEKEKLRYILPLRRNSILIDYTPTQSAGKKDFEGYFRYEDRLIWYFQKDTVWLFLDDALKISEQNDYLRRIDKQCEGYTLDNFHDKQHRFGTIAVLSNIKDVKARKVFEYLKSRVAVEVVFDAFKNILDADRTYMRGDWEMETWFFVNYLALLYYYRIYQILQEKELLKKYSPKDFLLYLSQVKKIRVKNEWKIAEIPKKVQTVLDKFDKPIP